MTLHKTILCDPPWNETGGGKTKRGADKHYSLLKTDEIISVVKGMMSGVVGEDAHLYLWATNSHLIDGLRVMDALGFRYVSNVVWVKNKIGLGRYFRGKHELCLFGVKGDGWSVRTSRNDISGVVHDKKREHSRKPSSFYDLIESRSHGPYLELFARAARPGWTAVGNQVGMYTP